MEGPTPVSALMHAGIVNAGKTGARLIVLGDESASLAPPLEESGFSLAQVGDLVASGDAAAAETALRDAQQRIDMAVSKGLLHKNTAARRKSRLAKQVTKTLG